MGFSDIIRQGVAIANSLTSDMQANVTHQAWIGQTGSGVDQFAPAVTRRALVDRSRKPMFTQAGKLIIVVATLTILEPIPPTTPSPNQQRINPVDPRDIFTLDDGTTAPIQKAGGFEDGGAAPAPYLNEIVLGNV